MESDGEPPGSASGGRRRGLRLDIKVDRSYGCRSGDVRIHKNIADAGGIAGRSSAALVMVVLLARARVTVCWSCCSPPPLGRTCGIGDRLDEPVHPRRCEVERIADAHAGGRAERLCCIVCARRNGGGSVVLVDRRMYLLFE